MVLSEKLNIGYFPLSERDEKMNFYYEGKRLSYSNGDWILTDSQSVAIPCEEFVVRRTLNQLKLGEIKGFGYTKQSLEKALSMFNNINILNK